MPPSREAHARKSFRLITLGGASLVAPDGKPAAEQRRRLALLVLLAASGARGVSRDKLTATLSPHSRTDSARHALHQLLYYLRRQVGEQAFLGTDPLRLDPQVVAYDVVEFEDAIARGRLEEAAALYRGPFLDGFHLGESAEFEEWASVERLRLAAKHADVLVRLAEEAGGRGDHGAASDWWRTLTANDPLNARWSIGLMRALAASGNRSGALRHGQKYQSLVREELESEPDPAVAALLMELRAQQGVVADPSLVTVSAVPVPEAEPDVALEFTPDDRPTLGGREAGDDLPPRRFRPLRMALGTATIVAAVALMATRREAPASDAPSLGVVPIVNTAGDSLDYLAEGIARSAMDRMSGSRGIRVVTIRDLQLPGAPAADVPALGRRVGVSAILTGTLARERDTLWLRVDVVRSRDGGRLASGRFAVETRSLAAIESALLDTVSVAVGLARMERDDRRPRDPDVSAMLMRAQYHFGKRDSASFARAFELYLAAIDRDPASAEAYAGLASLYGAFGFYGVMPIDVAFERGRAAANRALAIDSEAVQAITALAHEQGTRSWQWDEAERGLRHAVRLEPWRPDSWMLLGTELRMVGRFDESVAAYRNARDLDPLARHYTYQIAYAFQCAGEPDSALAALREAMTLGTSYPAAHAAAADLLASIGRYDEAIAEWRIAGVQYGDSALVRLLEGVRGRRGFEGVIVQNARRELARRVAGRAGSVVLPTEYATIYAMLGDTARALDWLERARDERDPNAPKLGCQWVYDPLRESPRFKALLQSMHLTPATFGRRPRWRGVVPGDVMP